jgi:hypothetical protein
MFDYNQKRYWYHISTRLNKRREFVLTPWGSDMAVNRDPSEPEGIRIPVAPSLEQSLTALVLSGLQRYHIYRTKHKVSPKKPKRIFDSNVTNEGWLLEPTQFIRIGSIKLDRVNLFEVADAACSGDVRVSRAALNFWKNADVWHHVQFSKNYDFTDVA